MVYSQMQSLTNVYLLNIQWHMATAKVVLIDVSVDEWKRNIQKFVSEVTLAGTVIRPDFIVLLL